jgi:hypothetical protein
MVAELQTVNMRLQDDANKPQMARSFEKFIYATRKATRSSVNAIDLFAKLSTQFAEVRASNALEMYDDLVSAGAVPSVALQKVAILSVNDTGNPWAVRPSAMLAVADDERVVLKMTDLTAVCQLGDWSW